MRRQTASILCAPFTSIKRWPGWGASQTTPTLWFSSRLCGWAVRNSATPPPGVKGRRKSGQTAKGAAASPRALLHDRRESQTARADAEDGKIKLLHQDFVNRHTAQDHIGAVRR